MILSRLFRAVALVSSVALVAPLLSSNAALAATATTTSVTATPSSAVAGQSVTLTATTSVPGTVNFTVGGQTVGTGISSPATSNLSHAQLWEWGPGNSIAYASDIDANGNVVTSGWNPGDCSGNRCKSKWITPAGGVTAFAGADLTAYGIAIDSSGIIYESNGSVIYKRSAYNQNPSVFLSSGLNNPCGLETDSNNNLYVANKGAGTILKVTPGGTATTYATGLASPCGLALNANTGVLYVVDGNGDIQSIASANSAPVLLVAAQCTSDSKIAIDSSGFLYGRACLGDEIVTQISPTGTMSVYLPAWYNLPAQSQGAGQNSARDIAVLNDSVYVTGAHMTASNLRRFNAASFRSTLQYQTTQPGILSLGASFTPSDSSTFSASSGTGSLSVVPAAPQAPDLATASDLGNSSTDNATSDNTPRIEVPGSYSSGNTITVTATKSGSTNVTCSYVIPATGCDLGTLADGTWSITATDSHPTSGASSASTALSITVDTSRPTAPTSVDLVTASDTGSSSTDNNTSDTTPTLGATGGVNGDTMTISATNGTTTVSCTYVIGSATNCTLPTLTDGTWDVSSTLTDPAGNTSLASSSIPITIDATGPQSSTPDLLAASDSGSSSTDDITSDNTPTITLTGQTVGDVITINATNGSSTIFCSYTVGSASNCTLATLSDGTWNISATATDAAGNTGTTQSLAVNIATSPPNRSTPDLTPASDTGRSNTDNISNDTTPEITIPGATTGDVVAVSATNGISTVTCTYTVGAAAGCSLPALSDGTWTVSASITDAAGNTGSASGSLSITIDSVAPATSSSADLLPNSDTGTSDSDNLTNDTTPSFSLPAGTNGDTVTISASKGGETKTCTYVVGVATQCDLPALSAGDWSVTATIADPAGNSSSPYAPINITIDSKSSTSTISGLNAVGLPSSSTTETKPVMKTGPNSLTGLIKISPNAGAKGATSVVFTVFDKSGKIVNFITKRLKSTDTSASVTVRNNGSLASIRVHTVNSVGVSQSARSGANVKRGKTSEGQLVAGLPKLRGDLLSEIMYFKPNSATLTPRTIQLLNQVARTINSRGGKLFVSGFARKNGIDTPKYLRNLSEQRALAVSMYLSSRGVRLWTTYQGFGAVTTEIGTPAERRVELRWVAN